MMAGVVARATRDRRGQALAEFALVLPLVLLFIAGIIEMGRAWNIKQAVTDAAREGARYSVVQDPAITTEDDVKTKIQERLALASIDTSTSTITFAGTFHGSGGEMTVTVSTPYQMGLIGALLGWAGAPSVVTVSTEATMRSEW